MKKWACFHQTLNGTLTMDPLSKLLGLLDPQVQGSVRPAGDVLECWTLEPFIFRVTRLLFSIES